MRMDIFMRIREIEKLSVVHKYLSWMWVEGYKSLLQLADSTFIFYHYISNVEILKHYVFYSDFYILSEFT